MATRTRVRSRGFDPEGSIPRVRSTYRLTWNSLLPPWNWTPPSHNHRDTTRAHDAPRRPQTHTDERGRTSPGEQAHRSTTVAVPRPPPQWDQVSHARPGGNGSGGAVRPSGGLFFMLETQEPSLAQSRRPLSGGVASHIGVAVFTPSLQSPKVCVCVC